MLASIKTLSSDEFEGRGPATPGEERTVKYLTEQFKSIGLAPGNPDGSYAQAAPLVGIRSRTELSFNADGRPLALKPREEVVALSRRFQPDVEVKDSEIVFVGYGIEAPEFQWDDYKGADLKGKTLLMLVNDPPMPDPVNPSQLDEKMFKGKAMTYYGRWTYKYEIASAKGAAAAIIIHETGPAGYPFAVVGESWGRENFEIQRTDKNAGRVAVEGWMSYDKAKQLCAMAGENLEELKKSALSRSFTPIHLKAAASFRIHNDVREVKSHNVVAKLEGSDPELKNQYLIYTAHWDHLGKDDSLKGDQIYNGAVDNASGTAALLELAKAYKKLSPAPKRSILFLSVTAEEKGLLGAKYYAENPLYPLKDTLAVINMDAINPWGRTKDITIVGLGNTTLDDIAEAVAKEQGRIIRPDAEPEKGFFYRSDHFEFAKQGVPALDPEAGIDFVGKPAGWGQQKRDEYTERDYHKVSDEVKPGWDLSGAVEDARLLFEVGLRVAQGDQFPEWKPGTEFKAKREAMLSGR